MNFREFVDKVTKNFPPREEDIQNDKNFLEDWTNAICLDGAYNYEQAYFDLLRSYSYKILPSAKTVTEILKMHKIKQVFKKCPKFKSIWADRGGLTYEFGIENTEEQTRRELKAMGFTNVRMQREQNTLQGINT